MPKESSGVTTVLGFKKNYINGLVLVVAVGHYCCVLGESSSPKSRRSIMILPKPLVCSLASLGIAPI